VEDPITKCVRTGLRLVLDACGEILCSGRARHNLVLISTATGNLQISLPLVLIVPVLRSTTPPEKAWAHRAREVTVEDPSTKCVRTGLQLVLDACGEVLCSGRARHNLIARSTATGNLQFSLP